MALSSFNQSISSISSISSTNAFSSQEYLKKHHYPARVCFVGDITYDMVEAAKIFNLEIVTSESGTQYIDDDQTLLVFSCFESEAFDNIMGHNLKGRIMGAPAFEEAAARHWDLPLRVRPILSLTMNGVVVCFTGITDRSLAMELMYMMRCMGGSVREDIGRWVTHVIALKTVGPKYDYARTFTIPAMSPEWVYQCWKKRYIPGISATDDDMMTFRQKPFIDCVALFLGFSPNEETSAMHVFVSNGGKLALPGDPSCTHVIVDDHSKCSIPESLPKRCPVVRSEWLWTCVQQIIRASEESYLIPGEMKERSTFELRKRQLQHCADSLEDQEKSDFCTSKRSDAKRSCVSTLSDDSLEYGATPAKLKKFETPISGVQELEFTSPKFEPELEFTRSSSGGSGRKPSISSGSTNTRSQLDGESTSKRTASFLELLQTEDNYVKILETVLGIKEEVLNTDQSGGALLTETEAKVIFSNITPIYEAHRTILHDLRAVQRHWNEAPSIGDVYSKISSDLKSAYGPFVTTYEESMDMMKDCEEKKPRFHAFNKIIRVRPECGRQALPDLMIRPVQRLGSTVLILREIKKNTPPDHPDFLKLQSALKSLSEVLSIINEDKRKMDTLCTVFDVFNLIEYCPPDIIASHRSLLIQLEAVQLTESGPSQIGDHIMLFIFTDLLLLAKKKSKVVAMTKKPAEELTDKILKLAHGKPYKFLEVIPHSYLKRILNVMDGQNIHNVFTMVTRGQDELRETHSPFRLVEGCGDKSVLLDNWCRAVATHTCTTGPDSFLLTIPADECGLSTSEVEQTQMMKASRMMVKTQCLLGSVFGKGGNPARNNKANKLRTPSFHQHGLNPVAFRTPSYSDLTDEVMDENCQELKTSSLTQNVAKKL